MPARPTTPQSLWKGFDPRSEPLEIVTVRRWRDRRSNLHAFYFTSETFDGETARIYAIYGAPRGARGRLPAVLHIHGGGQTATPQWLTFWNTRGYAAMTFNWGGLWDQRSRTAIWGDRLHHCNHKYAGAKANAMTPSPTECSWYHWTLASRRALTVLEQQKQVDPKRLGIFGISMGGTIVWNVAGIDTRVKAACAIYGVGWNSYPDSKSAPDPRAGDAETKLWRKVMAPEAYGPLMKCPVIFLSGSNDFHGKLDRAYDTLNSVPGQWAAAFTPHYNHHVAEAQGRNLPIWMDTFLKGRGAWPAVPAAELSLQDGVPQLTVRPNTSQRVLRVEVYYSLGNDNPKTRHWRTVRAAKCGDTWTAALPVVSVRQRLFAFAQVFYRRGMCLASTFVTEVPADLGKARATDRPSLQMSDFAKSTDDFATTCVGTDPHSFPRGLARVRGPIGRWGVRSVTGAAVITRKPGDPKWRGPDRARLAFDILAGEPVTLRIALKVNEGSPNQKLYEATVPIKSGRTWQAVRLASGRFKDAKGRPLANWRKIQMLEISTVALPTKRPVFTDFRWVAGRNAPCRP